MTFRVGSKVKRVTSALSSQNKGEILPGVTETWDGDVVEVPSNIMCSSTPRSINKILTIKYTVTVSFFFQSMHLIWRKSIGRTITTNLKMAFSKSFKHVLKLIKKKITMICKGRM